MALAKKCDRCGKLYEHYPLGNEAGIYNAIKRTRVGIDGQLLTESKHIDFCPDCMDRFIHFLHCFEKDEDEVKEICSAYHEETGLSNPSSRLGRCWGTKEMDICSCCGDTNKCDFYPEKRKTNADS